MLVFNVTDRPTSILESKGRVHTPIMIGGVLIKPGESAHIHKRFRSEVVQKYPYALILDALPPDLPPVKAPPEPPKAAEPPVKVSLPAEPPKDTKSGKPKKTKES